MEQTTQAPKPKIKYKTFTYHTFLKWAGNRAGILNAKGKPEFRVASPPEFKGEAGVWTPEDLFVASVDICTMTTFMAFAKHKNLPVVSYHTHAEGLLEFIDGKYQFTKIVLRPTIIVQNNEAVGQAAKTVEDAHQNCLVANSIKTAVLIQPKIQSVGLNGETKQVWRNPNA
ncbi:OsmC family protein [candidate division KSB1 bacterium]|nr:OsmC family protein [candidate division KSB1 bacterium]